MVDIDENLDCSNCNHPIHNKFLKREVRTKRRRMRAVGLNLNIPAFCCECFHKIMLKNLKNESIKCAQCEREVDLEETLSSLKDLSNFSECEEILKDLMNPACSICIGEAIEESGKEFCDKCNEWYDLNDGGHYECSDCGNCSDSTDEWDRCGDCSITCAHCGDAIDRDWESNLYDNLDDIISERIDLYVNKVLEYESHCHYCAEKQFEEEYDNIINVHNLFYDLMNGVTKLHRNLAFKAIFKLFFALFRKK